MNYANLYRIINACLKLDHVSSQKLLQSWCKKQQFENLKFSFSSYTRNYCSADGTTQAHKDDITVLPSPQEVTTILRKNEFNKDFTTGSVKSYDSNQLASNEPIEDTRSEAMCRMTPGLLFGVFDGHGGPACAQVVSKRLLRYIAASLLPQDLLKKYLGDASRETLIETFNDRLLACVALAYGRPEPPVGYSYSAPSTRYSSASLGGGHGGSHGGLSGGGLSFGGGHSSGGLSGGGLSFGGGHSSGGLSGGGISFGGSAGGFGGSGSGGLGGDSGFGGGFAGGFSGAPLVQKHIYVHVPPPEPEQQRLPNIPAVAPPQKHYKIIFIKAPAPPAPQTPIIPVQPQNEEKTLVYVLVKKPEEQADIVIPTAAPTQPSKPEVYFIKYQTQKEGGAIGGGAIGGGIGGGSIGGGSIGGGSIGGGDDLGAIALGGGSGIGGGLGGDGGHGGAEISADFGTSGGDEGAVSGHGGATNSQYGPPGHVAGPLH